jgi:hypothetical protein
VHHQVQQLGDIGLERAALGSCALGCFRGSHGIVPGKSAIGRFDMASSGRRIKTLANSGARFWCNRQTLRLAMC